MNVARCFRSATTGLALAVPGASCAVAPDGGAADAADDVPRFEIDVGWPKELPNDWLFGEVGGVAVDSRDHVWVFQRPRTLTERERGAALDPPLSVCCVPAPAVVVFDQEGNVVRAWGEPEEGYDAWFRREHGIFIDHDENVWLSDHELHLVTKFTLDGRHLLSIGDPHRTGGSNDPNLLGEPTDLFVDPETNELYVADGYLNRRVIVFDAETGEYRRHWGAYGERPDDSVDLGPYDPDVPPARQFRSPVHGVALSNDGLVYVADRRGDRIQVFQRDGTFVQEGFVAPRTRSTGSVYGIAFSPDPEQQFLYVPDGENNKIWILRRESLEIVGEFGRSGRYAGQFLSAHNLAVDSRGNIYVGETRGKRVQKFTLLGFGKPVVQAR